MRGAARVYRSRMDRAALQQVMVLANEPKEGDAALGGTLDAEVRGEARRQLAALKVKEVMGAALVEDGMTEAFLRAAPRDEEARQLAGLGVGEIKALLLGGGGAAWAHRHCELLPSEVIAAVVKVMSNAELSQVARGIFHPLEGRGGATGELTGELTIGAPGHFGSRIQPNSPGDSEREILFSVLEGLSYGCGDVILGLNPASDDLDTIVRLEQLLERVVTQLELPTRYCVLSDLVKQSEAARRTRVDVGFQSLAGTSQALRGMLGMELDGVAELARGFDGLYFETGQGSEVTNGAACGVDMVTLEARCYGAARLVRRQVAAKRGVAARQVWMIVNDVAGFIGPEVFRSAEQLLRACLEDTVMAKLHGLTMGLDVCSTFHMGIEPQELHRLTQAIVMQAAPAYLMAVAGNADPMLGYLTTSFRQHPQLRRACGAKVTGKMERRLGELGVAAGGPLSTKEQVAELYAQVLGMGGGGSAWSGLEAARQEGLRAISELQEAGFDLGHGHDREHDAPPAVQARLGGLYRHARKALYATLAESVVRDATTRPLRVATQAGDREDYIAHPPAGEAVRDADRAAIRAMYEGGPPQVQLVISDGLNADAVNESLRAVLPAIRARLAAAGCRVGARDVVIRNGRVRAGYDVGELLGVEVIVHLIGERPGTGLDQLSAYLTYGRDARGQLRWARGLDHSCTTAICGIHRQGKPAEVAVEEIVGNVKRMIEERRSGVALGTRVAKH